MKITIIGYSGSGKSTLARHLKEYYDIPCLHLDSVKFYGNWEERSREEMEEIVNKFIDENESWVIEGTYRYVSLKRFYESDITIFLNFNRFYCYKMARRRAKMYKNKYR